MPPNQLLIGQHALIVHASSLPTGFNQRPGVTLLLAQEQPLQLEITGIGEVNAQALLLPPEVQRRFTSAQRHISITVEPGHPSYCSLLRWARSQIPVLASPQVKAADFSLLAALTSQSHFDDWLGQLLARHAQPVVETSVRLEYLLQLVAMADEETSAESLWQSFRTRYPGSQAYCSHWLQDELGLSLRKLLLWRKLRRALESLVAPQAATDIAHASGFADSAHLSRICLRTFGLRPSQANDRKILQVSRLTVS
jgi:hypothetical protein